MSKWAVTKKEIHMINNIPPAIEDGTLVPTLNNQGWIWTCIDDPITQAYLAYAKRTKGNCLEVGAGYGDVVMKALEDGSSVTANDIDANQLAIIQERANEKKLTGLTLLCEKFPTDFSIAENSFDAILISRVLHFFSPSLIQESLAMAHKVLKPNGKLFLLSDSVYRTIFQYLIPDYENRIKEGDQWPGWFDNVCEKYPKDLDPKQQPPAMNFLDPEVLTRELQSAHFTVEFAQFVPYKPEKPTVAHLDGRESMGAIARK